MTGKEIFERQEEQYKEKLINSTPSQILKYWSHLSKKHKAPVCVRRVPRNGFLVYLRTENKQTDLAWSPQYSGEITTFFINGSLYNKKECLQMLSLKAFW